MKTSISKSHSCCDYDWNNRFYCLCSLIEYSPEDANHELVLEKTRQKKILEELISFIWKQELDWTIFRPWNIGPNSTLLILAAISGPYIQACSIDGDSDLALEGEFLPSSVRNEQNKKCSSHGCYGNIDKSNISMAFCAQNFLSGYTADRGRR